MLWHSAKTSHKSHADLSYQVTTGTQGKTAKGSNLMTHLGGLTIFAWLCICYTSIYDAFIQDKEVIDVEHQR